MVDVKDCSFPGLIIVVVREAFVALGDEPIGTHLQEGGGEIRPACVSLGFLLCVCGGGQGSWILVLSLGVWVQDPWKHACTQAGVRTQAPPPTPSHHPLLSRPRATPELFLQICGLQKQGFTWSQSWRAVSSRRAPVVGRYILQWAVFRVLDLRNLRDSPAPQLSGGWPG